MVNLSQITLHFGERPIFDNVSFQINAQDRIGLVGRNGAGKSTMLKVLTGLIKPQAGEVAMPADYSIGYLSQELTHDSDETVFNEVISARSEEQKISRRIDEIQHHFDAGVSDEDEMAALLEEFNELNERFLLIGGQSAEELVERVLKGLGFQRDDFDRPLKEFSGGWKMRVELAKLLVSNPDLLLLDEPTNHLDIESIEWLETFLQTYSGAVVVISHDVAFLDAVTNRTIEVVNGKVRDYKVPYTKYLEQREQILEKQKQEARNQEKYVKNTEELINKFRAKSSKASFAQSLIKKLDRLEKVEVDEDNLDSLNLRFGEVPRAGKVVMRAEDLGKAYGAHRLFQNLNFEIERGEKIALIGKNGIGKTTLLRMLVGDETGEGKAELGHNVSLGYFAQHQTSTLSPGLSVFEVIDQEAKGEMRTKVRSLLGAFLFSGDDIHKKVKVLSGGEKSRLALCRLMLNSYNLLIMDEPTNHLDIDSKNILKRALMQYSGALLIVSHDRHFLQGLTSRLFEIRSGELKSHHEDISSFLAHRNAENIADFERKKSSGPVKKSSSGDSRSGFEQRKQLEKEIKKHKKESSDLERKIALLQEKIDQMNEESAQLDFTLQDQVRARFEEIAKAKLQLEKLEEEWLLSLEKLETAELQFEEMN